MADFTMTTTIPVGDLTVPMAMWPLRQVRSTVREVCPSVAIPVDSSMRMTVSVSMTVEASKDMEMLRPCN